MLSNIKKSTIIPAIIALLFGLFIGKSVTTISTPTSEAGKNDISFRTGEVFLMQLGQFSEENDALSLTEDLNKLSISAVSVYDSNVYYVYTDISLSKDKLETVSVGLENMGYTPFIKKVYLINCLTNLIPHSFEYNYWYEGIQYYLYMINDFKVNSLDSLDINLNVNTIDFYNNLSMLNITTNHNVRTLIKLNTYKILVENI